MNLIDSLTLKVSNLIMQGVHSKMTDREFLEREIIKWKNSPQRIMQIKGHLYYDNEHDILKRKRTMIGEDGKLQIVENLPNNRIIDNQYAKMVNQKAILKILCRKEVMEMAVIYATLIVKGKKTFSDVPDRIKAQVKEVLTDLDCPELAE
jgi:hypothetical protein